MLRSKHPQCIFYFLYTHNQSRFFQECSCQSLSTLIKSRLKARQPAPGRIVQIQSSRLSRAEPGRPLHREGGPPARQEFPGARELPSRVAASAERHPTGGGGWREDQCWYFLPCLQSQLANETATKQLTRELASERQK